MQKVKVQKNNCPLNVIAEMGEDAKKFCFFMDQNCFDHLRRSADSITFILGDFIFEWKANGEYPQTKVILNRSYGKWYFVNEIQAADIAFTKKAEYVRDNIFLEKEA